MQDHTPGTPGELINAAREKLSHRAVNLGLVANIFLALVKTIVGIWGHSHALLADGVNSTSDVVYYVIVKIFLRLSHKPPDAEHPYGHRQFETIAALVVGSFIITTAAAIFWNAISTAFELITGSIDSEEISILALIIAIFTVLLKIFLTLWTHRAGARTGNAAVEALASDHRNDIYASSAASIGILLGKMGLPWVDPLAGALVALFILRIGIEILRDTTADLMDTVPGYALAKQIREELSGVEEIRKIIEIHAHRFGPAFVINLTIGLDSSLSVEEANRIAITIKDTLYTRMEYVLKIYVDYQPYKPEERG